MNLYFQASFRPTEQLYKYSQEATRDVRRLALDNTRAIQKLGGKDASRYEITYDYDDVTEVMTLNKVALKTNTKRPTKKVADEKIISVSRTRPQPAEARRMKLPGKNGPVETIEIPEVPGETRPEFFKRAIGLFSQELSEKMNQAEQKAQLLEPMFKETSLIERIFRFF